MCRFLWTALITTLLTLSAVSGDARQANHNGLKNVDLVKRCPLGHEAAFDRQARKYECKCKKYHLFWPQDGLCYREYQQGPCPAGHRYVYAYSVGRI